MRRHVRFRNTRFWYSASTSSRETAFFDTPVMRTVERIEQRGGLASLRVTLGQQPAILVEQLQAQPYQRRSRWTDGRGW